MNKKKMIPKLRRKLFRLLSKRIHEDFDNACCMCGAKGKVDCHHIVSRTIARLSFEPLNCVLLCSSCHKFSRHSAHKNPVNFILWLIKNEKERFDYIVAHMNEDVKYSLDDLLEIEKNLQ